MITKEQRDAILAILVHDRDYGEELSIRKFPNYHSQLTGQNDLLITFGQMYDRPKFTLNQAKALQEFFDCEDIRQGEYSHPGCETCDYGSEYGHELHIVNPKKNLGSTGLLVKNGYKILCNFEYANEYIDDYDLSHLRRNKVLEHKTSNGLWLSSANSKYDDILIEKIAQ